MDKRKFDRTIAIEEWVCDDVPSPLGRLTIAGTATHRGITSSAMRVLNCYVVILLLEGNGSFQDANRNRAGVAPGDLMLLFPGVGHSYGPSPSGVWRELFLHFEGPLFTLMQQQGVLDPRRPVHRALPLEVWRDKLLDIARTPRFDSVPDSTDKMCRLASLLGRLTADQSPLPPQEDWFEHACRMLKGNINEPLDLETVAQAVGMSYPAFREKFRGRAGMPVGRYRLQERVEVARRMLEREELTARAISKSMGFGGEANFSRRFSQIVGVSPRRYRQQKRQDNANTISASVDDAPGADPNR